MSKRHVFITLAWTCDFDLSTGLSLLFTSSQSLMFCLIKCFLYLWTKAKYLYRCWVVSYIIFTIKWSVRYEAYSMEWDMKIIFSMKLKFYCREEPYQTLFYSKKFSGLSADDNTEEVFRRYRVDILLHYCKRVLHLVFSKVCKNHLLNLIEKQVSCYS